MKRTLTAEQTRKRDERRAKLREVWGKVAAMPEADRLAMAYKLGIVTCEGHQLSANNQVLIMFQGGAYRSWRNMKQRCPPGMSIERKNNLLGYFPDNCKWATMIEQANNKRSVKMITRAGKTQSLAGWCRELGLKHDIVRQRFYQRKWNIERALQP